MIDDKNIDLDEFGISLIVDARDIKTISYEHTQNHTLSHLVVVLKNSEKLVGPAVIGSNAVCLQERLFSIYQQIIGGG